jgi:hypothetical protein
MELSLLPLPSLSVTTLYQSTLALSHPAPLLLSLSRASVLKTKRREAYFDRLGDILASSGDRIKRLNELFAAKQIQVGWAERG